MNKSISIINTPKTCGDCPLCIYTAEEKRYIGYCNTSDEDYYCKALERFMKYDKVDGGADILGKPIDCPLRAEPVGNTDKLPSAEKTGWIPVSERLPDNDTNVLCWYEYYRYGNYNRMFETYGIGTCFDGMWCGDITGEKTNVIAWMPLPEPYRADMRGTENE